MTEKTQQDTQSSKATPVFKGIRTGIFKSTPANEGPIEAKELPSDENVVKHELGEPSAQKTFGLHSPPCENSSDPSSDDDQQRGELKEMSSGESSGPQDSSVVQVGHDPVHAEKSCTYPTAPPSPDECEVLAEGLAGLDLDGKGEQELGPGPDECIQPKDRGSEQAISTTKAVPNMPSSEPASEGNALLEEESSNSVKSVGVIVPAPDSKESIVLALEVTREDPRNAESEQSEAEDEQSGDQGVQASESEDDDEDGQVTPGDTAAITRQLRELRIPKIWRAPNSYFYASTTTYEGITAHPKRTANGRRQCFASTPSRDRCKNSPPEHLQHCPVHSLYLRGHHFRVQVLSHPKVHLGMEDFVYLDKYQKPHHIASAKQFKDFAAGFHPLIQKNLYNLIMDFLLVLGHARDKDEILKRSESVIANKCRLPTNNMRTLRAECKKPGQVYMLVCLPGEMYLNKMWFAGDKVRNIREMLPVKIGQSKSTVVRISQHSRCNIMEEPREILPDEESQINFVYLLELMIHELCVAHQHDLLCGCPRTYEKNHVEVFWFERLSGGSDLHEDFRRIVDALRDDIEKCQEFVKLLGVPLYPLVLSR